MDLNTGDFIKGRHRIGAVDREIGDLMLSAAGQTGKSEELGHREFILTYKGFEPTGPAPMPRIARRN